MFALWLAIRDPRVGWHVKVLAAAIVAYALSPIDLIPDFIPVLGYLDDIIIVPLGILLVVKLIPESIMTELRVRAASSTIDRSSGRIAAAIIISLWLALCALVILRVTRS